MAKNKKPLPLLVTQDRACADFVGNSMGREGIRDFNVVTHGRGWLKRALDACEGLLLLAPSHKLGPDQLTLAKNVTDSGGLVLVWKSQPPADSWTHDNEWLIESLLSQHVEGSVNLLAVIKALRIYQLANARPTRTIKITGRKSNIKSRAAARLNAFGFITDKATSGHSWSLKISGNGEALLNIGTQVKIPVHDLALTSEALSLLVPFDLGVIDEPTVNPSSRDLTVITRPPKRLLSEVTSKRLFSCFGIGAPPEQLCNSASKAEKFAKTLFDDGHPAVLKLAKPEFENKTSCGAVISDLNSASDVRAGTSRLFELDSSLPSPEALGVIVCQQIDGGLRLWIKRLDHPRLGKIVIVGSGDSPGTSADFAFDIPASANSVYHLLLTKFESEPAAKMARAICRFSQAADQLGPLASRLEIHPLVATEMFDEAVALDALAMIDEP